MELALHATLEAAEGLPLSTEVGVTASEGMGKEQKKALQSRWTTQPSHFQKKITH